MILFSFWLGINFALRSEKAKSNNLCLEIIQIALNNNS